MYLQRHELCNRFPKIKLCYDNIIHNKVVNPYDICCAIPCGKKSFIWFTTLNDKNVCLHYDTKEFKLFNCVFNNDLTYGIYGTILYGTLFHHSGSTFFSIEDVFYYKGCDVGTNNWFKKLGIFKKIFDHDVKQISYNKNFIVLGLPLMAKNEIEIKRLIDTVDYKIFNVQFRSYGKTNTQDSISLREFVNLLQPQSEPQHQVAEEQKQPSSPPTSVSSMKIQDLIGLPKQNIKPHNNNNTPLNNNVVFRIKADIQNDIYHLYCNENLNEVFYNIAYIPDYKTSVMMNTLFRNIKENDNLDLLEESDNEDEFQNENIDKFVDLEKTILMVCKFNYKFKKWYPVKEVQGKNVTIIDKNELVKYEVYKKPFTIVNNYKAK